MCSQLLANDIQLTTSLVGPSHSSINSSTPIRISPTEDIGQKHYDLVIIAPLGPVPTNGFDFDDALIQWLVDSQRKRGAVASVCTGAFLVAATGLLDQRRATTHWKYASQFRQQFPLVDLQIDSMLTHDGTLFC